MDAEKRVTKLLKEKEEELHRVSVSSSLTLSGPLRLFLRQLAHALVEHETLDAEEVMRVIKGLPIRGLKEKVLEVQEKELDLVPQSVVAAPM
jgi:ATP-dependent metalloprotease